ncbi:MAG: ribonuclease HIII [Bacilli bacterium]
MSITIKLTPAQVASLKARFAPFQVASKDPYVFFKAKNAKDEITVYSNAKGEFYRTVFRGPKAEHYALEYGDELPKKNTSSPPKVKRYQYLGEQIGSDEVGFGDFFGPIVVVAAYLQEGDYQFLDLLKVTDSKKMDDATIRKIGPLLMQRFPGVHYTVDNEKFNQLTARGYNMNKIKAMLHNQGLSRLRSQYPGAYPAYIDQFCAKETFITYLNAPLVADVYFHEKAEDLFPSVALASVVARYIFLRHMDELNARFNLTFPLGASVKVDEFGREFVKKHGIATLNSICKMNFKNYRRIIDHPSSLLKE